MQITIREPGSALTHFIAMLLTVVAAIPLLVKAALNVSVNNLPALAVFAGSMTLLYAASTLYHSVNFEGSKLRIFKRIDHMMIFVLIAGSYTPVCLLALDHKIGYPLFKLVWGIALVGMVIKLFWVTCPKWFSSILYIAMGWVVVIVFRPLFDTLPLSGFLWLLAGGIIYTIGGVIYALKLPIFNSKHKSFGSHEIFHLFVMGGSLCHFLFMYLYIA